MTKTNDFKNKGWQFNFHTFSITFLVSKKRNLIGCFKPDFLFIVCFKSGSVSFFPTANFEKFFLLIPKLIRIEMIGQSKMTENKKFYKLHFSKNWIRFKIESQFFII
jgi:hypothetical protein